MTAALFVGDVSLDLTMVADHVPAPDEKVHVDEAIEAPGGVVANAAVACAHAGSPARLLLRVGSDAAGRVVAEGLAAAGVQVEVDPIEGRTCRVVVIVEPHGEKRLLLDPGVSMYPGQEAVEAVSLDGIGWLHTAAYGAAAERLIARCRDAGIAWSLDLEPASFAEGIDTILPLLDGAETLFLNDRANATLGGDGARRLLALGARSVIRTRGRDGAELITAAASTSIPAPVIGHPVDTTGAGDCLAGWYIGERLAGSSPTDALTAAVTAATLSCLGLGAQPSYPSRPQVAAARKTIEET